MNKAYKARYQELEVEFRAAIEDRNMFQQRLENAKEEYKRQESIIQSKNEQITHMRRLIEEQRSKIEMMNKRLAAIRCLA